MNKKFTLIELLVVIVIIAILLSLLLPSLGKAKRKAKQTSCLSNMKNVGMAATLYVNSNNFVFPKITTGGTPHKGRLWMGKKGSESAYPLTVSQRPLNKYLGYTQDGVEVPGVECPFNKDMDSSVDVYNAKGSSYYGNSYSTYTSLQNKRMSDVQNSSTTVLSTEAGAFGYAQKVSSKWWRWVHQPGKAIYPFVFVDGHVAQHELEYGEGVYWESSVANLKIDF